MYIIITGSTNKDGLTAECGKKMKNGIEKAGGQAEIIDLFDVKLEPCRACGDGWGMCWESGKCVIDDSLAEIQKKIRDSEGMILITPVYWGEPSEMMKRFCDRFRRIEATRQGGGWAAGKQTDLIAAAGGTGNGTVSCLTEMELWCKHIGAIPQERISITRFNRHVVLNVIEDAGSRLVRGEYYKG